MEAESASAGEQSPNSDFTIPKTAINRPHFALCAKKNSTHREQPSVGRGEHAQENETLHSGDNGAQISTASGPRHGGLQSRAPCPLSAGGLPLRASQSVTVIPESRSRTASSRRPAARRPSQSAGKL